MPPLQFFSELTTHEETYKDKLEEEFQYQIKNVGKNLKL